MPTIHDQIIAGKRREIEEARRRTPEAALRERLAEAPAVRTPLRSVPRGPSERAAQEPT